MQIEGEPVRLIESGFSLTHEIKLAKGKCYEAALAWSYPARASATIIYVEEENGTRPNDQIGSEGGTLDGGVGTIHFCADNPGRANLTISSIDDNDIIYNQELLEYLLVLGSKKESSAEAKTRRADETAREGARQARADANIAAAKEREQKALARVCRECEDALILCRVNRATATPRKGLTVQNSCELDFKLCVYDRAPTRPRSADEMPCGQP